MWEIIDNNGSIYTGNMEEMMELFDKIVNCDVDIDWEGDLKLIHVINIYK